MDRFPDVRSQWFSPLQMLELDACTRCQECVGACPVVGAGYPDGAMERIAGWRRLGAPSTRLLSRLARRPSSESDRLALFSSLYRCTSCGACSVVCESGISLAPLWESMRGAGREMGFCDAEVERIAGTVLEGRNPFGRSRGERAGWIPAGTRIADAAPIGFFAGCTSAFRQPEIGLAALRVLERSGTGFCMLGKKESCCGSFLFRTGSWKTYGETIVAMIDDLRERGVETLLVLCAGCLKTIAIDWPRVYGRELPFRVVPFSVFLRDLVRDGTIRFGPGRTLRVAYHDPCHGGRQLMHRLGRDWVFEAPREVLAAMPGVEVVEFERNREHQVCCGAGGGVKAEDPDLALAIARRKVAAADGMHADLIASTCPFCRRNLDDVREAVGSPVECCDVVQLADRMMDRPSPR
ncbi:MAG: (Fe-S)-binding protein [Methanospirillum sp.]